MGAVGVVVHNCKLNSWNEFQKGTAGQYATRGEAADAYRTLRDGKDPWPVGASPTHDVMRPGERFQMAMSPGQPLDAPGRFGTTDSIPDVNYARESLAVTENFKPTIGKVTEFEVVNPLPVRRGPVGPQVDAVTGQFRPGGGTQIELMVDAKKRMGYLRVVGFRLIH